MNPTVIFVVYLHKHFKACDPLKGQDEERGQGQSLADGVFLQTSQNAVETRVLLPEKASNRNLNMTFSKCGWKFQQEKRSLDLPLASYVLQV